MPVVTKKRCRRCAASGARTLARIAVPLDRTVWIAPFTACEPYYVTKNAQLHVGSSPQSYPCRTLRGHTIGGRSRTSGVWSAQYPYVTQLSLTLARFALPTSIWRVLKSTFRLHMTCP